MFHQIKKGKAGIRKRPVIVAVIFVLIAALAVVFAKYVFLQSDTKETGSSEMYFTSDFLSKSGSSYTLTPGTDSVTIELRNYVDDLRWSEKDIQYSYTVTKQWSGESVKSGSGTISRSADHGSSSSVTIDGLGTGTYEVTATATAPFTETLKGTFTIPAESSGIDYSVSDSEGSPYALLTVSTENYKGNVTLSWPAGVIPDSTQEAFAGVTTRQTDSYAAGTITVAVQPYSSYTYRFFKEDVTKDHSSLQTIKAVEAK